MFRHAFFSFLTLLFFQNIHAQEEVINLENPSFEGRTGAGDVSRPMAVRGWHDCGFPGETPPDVHPEPLGGLFGVTIPPHDGQSYVGMVVRDNETCERIGQKLNKPLRAGQSYVFSVHLARSSTYQSISRTTLQETQYTTPCVLRIWGGKGYCDRGQLLAESELVSDFYWKKYPFILSPEGDCQFLTFEAYYKTPSPFPYNGHLLIDDASSLVSEGGISDFTKKDSLPSANTEAPKIDFAPLSKKENFFGASFEISVLPKVDSTGQKQDSMARLALEQVLERAVEIEKSVNGDLEKLYAAAKENKGIVPGDDLWFILNFAKEAWERTEGTFEVTMGKLEQLWRENAAEKRKPKPRDIYALQKVSSLEYVRINKEVGGIRLLLPDLPMDVTGLAKGYLLDCLADLFYELGHKQFFIQSEGMAIAGDVPKKLLKWRPVRPYYHWGSKHETNTFIFNSAMVTTEPKEVLMEKYGDTFYSLVDPVSGDVIRHNSIVTVEAPSAMHAYAWARALTINYDEDFYQWLESQDIRVWYSEP